MNAFAATLMENTMPLTIQIVSLSVLENILVEVIMPTRSILYHVRFFVLILKFNKLNC